MVAAVFERELIEKAEKKADEVVNNRLASVRDNLEKLVNQVSVDAAIREKFNEVLKSLDELDEIYKKNPKIKSILQKIIESQGLIKKLLNQYSGCIPHDVLSGLQDSLERLTESLALCEKFKIALEGIAPYLSKIVSINSISERSRKKDLEAWASALQGIARNFVVFEELAEQSDVPADDVLSGFEDISVKIIQATVKPLKIEGGKSDQSRIESFRTTLFITAKFLLAEIDRRRKVKLEGQSAEAKAVARMSTLDDDSEWITVVERNETIDLDELDAQLRASGYIN